MLGMRLGAVLHSFPGIWDLEMDRAIACLAESLHCYWKSEISRGDMSYRDALLKGRMWKKPLSLVEIMGRTTGRAEGMLGLSRVDSFECWSALLQLAKCSSHL